MQVSGFYGFLVVPLARQTRSGFATSANTTCTTKIFRLFWLVVANGIVRPLSRSVYLDSLLVCSLKESSETEVSEGGGVPFSERKRNGRTL